MLSQWSRCFSTTSMMRVRHRLLQPESGGDPGPSATRSGQPPETGRKQRGGACCPTSRRIRLISSGGWMNTLGPAVPGIARVDRWSVGSKETVEFRQEVRGSPHPWRFLASNMSDGTLRALGVLVAIFQGPETVGRAADSWASKSRRQRSIPRLLECFSMPFRTPPSMRKSSSRATGPDLLDNHDIPDESILAVVAEYGETRFGPRKTKIGSIDQAGRSALRDRLFHRRRTPPDGHQLRPDPALSDLDPPGTCTSGCLTTPSPISRPSSISALRGPRPRSASCGGIS